MQTAKTAAVVVLMMSVMYGTYVSLTTPPEPVPDEIADELLVMDDLQFDDGLPDSLQAMGEQPEQLVAQTADEPALGGASSMGSTDSSLEVADLAPTPDSGSPGLATAVASLAPGPSKLPTVEPDAASGGNLPNAEAEIATNAYQSTGTTFQVPDPNSVDVAINPPESEASKTAAVTFPDSEVSQTTAIEPSPNLGMVNAIETADRQFGKDQLRDALATLSLFYNTPNMTSNERVQLLSRLDPLAREVIYSRRHLLEQPHRVGQNETLEQIADTYKVPWQVLANINGISDPKSLLPGTELKVLRGPFNAQVNLDSRELTLFLGDLYAGRFPIDIGTTPPPKIGSFVVQDKQTNRTYYGGASPVPPGNPDNPYGTIWIDLGSQQCIHGSPDPHRPTDKGCISLAGDLADDLYGILSQGSSVTVRR